MTKESISFADQMNSYMKHKQEKESKKSFGYLDLPKDIETFNMDENIKEVLIDIIPYRVSDPNHPDYEIDNTVAKQGNAWWKRSFLIHRNVGESNGTVICPKSVKKRCPICDYQKKRIKEGADKEEFKEYYPKPRSLYAIIPRATMIKGSKKWEYFDELIPYVWDMSIKLFEELLDESIKEDPSINSFMDLKNGFSLDLSIHWDIIGKNRFPTVSHIEFIERDPYEDSVIDMVPDLDKMLKILSYEEIEAKFHDMDKVEEEEEAPRKIEDEYNKEKNSSEETPRRLLRPVSTQVKTEISKPSLGEVKRTRISLRDSHKVEKSENTAPSAKTPLRTISKKEENDNDEERCQFGYRFGVDAMDYKECEEECDIWNECLKERKRRGI